MEKRIIEEAMKKMLLAAALIVIFGFRFCVGSGEKPHFVNISFTVWKSKMKPMEAAHMIHAPIQRACRDSWGHDLVSLDVSDRKPHNKLFEKDNLRFVLTAEYKDRLTIQVFEKDKEIFMFVHNRPSTIDYIFYDTDGHTYLVDLCYTVGNHPIGLLSPGILKK
jgi:hypothetical protein